jgi:hypothetical protein
MTPSPDAASARTSPEPLSPRKQFQIPPGLFPCAVFWQRPKSEGSGSSRTGNAFCIQQHVLAMAGAHECLAIAMSIKYLRPFNCLLSVKKPHSNGRGGEPQDGLHPGAHLSHLFNSIYWHFFLSRHSNRPHSSRSKIIPSHNDQYWN